MIDTNTSSDTNTDALGDHASMLIAATTTHLGVETVHHDFTTPRDALDADTIQSVTCGEDWNASYAMLQRGRTIFENALHLLDHQP